MLSLEINIHKQLSPDFAFKKHTNLVRSSPAITHDLPNAYFLSPENCEMTGLERTYLTRFLLLGSVKT
jgi:hypothetical protein